HLLEPGRAPLPYRRGSAQITALLEIRARLVPEALLRGDPRARVERVLQALALRPIRVDRPRERLARERQITLLLVRETEPVLPDAEERLSRDRAAERVDRLVRAAAEQVRPAEVPPRLLGAPVEHVVRERAEHRDRV